MASIFPSLMSSMGVPEEEQKKDIFAQPGQDPNAMAMQNNAQGASQAGGSYEKASTEGELAPGSQGAGGGGGTQVAGQEQPAVSTEGDRAALKASAGKVKNPGLVDKTKATIADQNAKLQQEADAYVQKAKSVNYGLGNDEIERGLAGDDTALSRVRSTLGKKAIDPYEGFKTTADTNLEDVDRFQSDAGIRDILRREGGDEYTAGMGAFDLSALKRTPGFENLAQSLREQRDALRSKADTYKTDKTTEAQNLIKANLDASQKGIRDYLSSQRSALEAANAEEARKANEGRAGRYDAAKADLQRRALEELKKKNPDLSGYLDQGDIDAGQYITGEGRDYDWRDMVDDNEAVRFERLLGSLGVNDAVTKGRGVGNHGYDLAGYEGALLSKAQEKAAAAAKKKADDEAAAAALAAAQPEPAAPQKHGWVNAGDVAKAGIGDPLNEMATSAIANILGGPGLRTVNKTDREYNPLTPAVNAAIDRNTGGDTKKILKKLGLGR